MKRILCFFGMHQWRTTSTESFAHFSGVLVSRACANCPAKRGDYVL